MAAWCAHVGCVIGAFYARMGLQDQAHGLFLTIDVQSRGLIHAALVAHQPHPLCLCPVDVLLSRHMDAAQIILGLVSQLIAKQHGVVNAAL